MDPADEFSQDFDPLDPTKTWPEDKFPLMPVGIMMLDRNPENYFADHALLRQAGYTVGTASAKEEEGAGDGRSG